MSRRSLDVVGLVLTFLSGKQLECRLKRSQDIMSVKRWIKHEVGIRTRRIALLRYEVPCRDDVLLLNLIEHEQLPVYSILCDLVPAATVMPAKPLRLQVVLKDAITTCDGCAQEGCDYPRCAQCLSAWYCSVERQRVAWPYHKNLCRLNIVASGH